jgi:hypothetical protein
MHRSPSAGRDHCAQVAALTRIYHILARADALDCLPDNRDVTAGSVLPGSVDDLVGAVFGLAVTRRFIDVVFDAGVTF